MFDKRARYFMNRTFNVSRNSSAHAKHERLCGGPRETDDFSLEAKRLEKTGDSNPMANRSRQIFCNFRLRLQTSFRLVLTTFQNVFHEERDTSERVYFCRKYQNIS